ncbi:UNVERIFIED_CONTAM: hypothetical protein ABID98_002424 [Brevibacillus sp. OAP136]
MADIITVTGAVSHRITIDPSVWIFDDRKIDLAHFTGDLDEVQDDVPAYLKGTGAQWDKELKEGSLPPSESRSMIKERKALVGDYAMRLSWFLDNAQPDPTAVSLKLHREEGEPITLPLSQARRAILQFSKDGRPIRENGPVLLYLPDMWKQKESPIDRIVSFELI